MTLYGRCRFTQYILNDKINVIIIIIIIIIIVVVVVDCNVIIIT